MWVDRVEKLLLVAQYADSHVTWQDAARLVPDSGPMVGNPEAIT
jgi:hypothetical protein